MIHSLYHEILKMIMKNLNRSNSSVRYRPSSNLNPLSQDEQIKANDPSSLLSGFDGYDYHLMYDSEDNFTSWTSHSGKVSYVLVYDSFDDLIKIKVSSKEFSFAIALIYANYDLRKDLIETDDKGNLTDVVLLDDSGNPLIKGFRIDPIYQESNIGEDVQFHAYATLITGSEIDVTDVVLWNVVSPLTIVEGLVSNTVSGLYTITANYQNASIATAELKVSDIELFLNPATITIDQGDVAKFNLYRKIDQQITLVNHLEVAWLIDSGVINEYGVVSDTYTMDGSYQITASYKNNLINGTLIVKTPKLVIVPDTLECQVGEVANFSAIVQRVSGDTDVTDLSNWTVASPLIVSNGSITTDLGVQGSTYLVSCTYSFDLYSLSADGNLKLMDDKLEIVPSTQRIFIGQIALFRANYVSGGITRDVTSDLGAVWTVNSPCTISRGKVTNTNVLGNYPVTVTYNGKTSEATLTIQYPDLRIEPTAKTIKMGESFQFQAIYNQSGSDVNVTNNLLTEWEIDSANLTIHKGFVTNTVNIGAATVTARYNGYTATATLTIQDISLVIDPASHTIYKGETFKFTALMDGADVTNTSNWSVNLSPLQINFGLVSNTNNFGSAIVTAVYAGKTATATLVILDSQLVITPTTHLMEVGSSSQFQFKAFLSKGASNTEVTNVATWSISPSSPVFVNKGSVTNLNKPGTYNIVAKYDGKTSNATLTITEKLINLDTTAVKLQLRDDEDIDGDSVRVSLNGHVVANRIDLTGTWSTVNLTLNVGSNTLRLGALYNGTIYNYSGGPVTAAVRITKMTGEILYNNIPLHIEAPTTGKLTVEKGPLDPNKYYKDWIFAVS